LSNQNFDHCARAAAALCGGSGSSGAVGNYSIVAVPN